MAPHLVAALAHGIGAVLGQVAADEEGSEVPAVRELLKALAGLAGAVLAAGAMHARHDTAQLISGRGAGCMNTTLPGPCPGSCLPDRPVARTVYRVVSVEMMATPVYAVPRARRPAGGRPVGAAGGNSRLRVRWRQCPLQVIK
jgi:hypothetical protein